MIRLRPWTSVLLLLSGVYSQAATGDECLTGANELANLPRLDPPPTSVPLNLPIKVTLSLQSGTSTTTPKNLTNTDIALHLRRYYGEAVTQNCQLPPAACCRGFITVDSHDVQQVFANNILTIEYTAYFIYSQFQVCPTADYQKYFTNPVTSRQNIYSTFLANSYTELTANYPSILSYSFNSQLCTELVGKQDQCPGNSVCWEADDEPRAECISVCNTTEYSAKFGNEFCKNDYPCCQTSLDTAGYCECNLYTAGNFVFGADCATQIPLWAMVLIILGGLLLIILLTIFLIYCCCPSCCMCCFEKRVKRMEQAKKEREAKRKHEVEVKTNRKSKKATTPIRQVARDGSQFYTNRSYAPDEAAVPEYAPVKRQSRQQIAQNMKPMSSPETGSSGDDDRMHKALQNGRVLSTMGYKSTVGSTLARNQKDNALMESSLDGFQTGEPSEPSVVGPEKSRSDFPSASPEAVNIRHTTNSPSPPGPGYVPKGAVPSIGPPTFTALINEVKQGQERNRSLSSQVYKEDSHPRDHSQPPRSSSGVNGLRMSNAREHSMARSELTQASSYNRQDLWRSPGTENLRINTDTYISDV